MVGVREFLVSFLHDKWVVAISSLTPAIRGMVRKMCAWWYVLCLYPEQLMFMMSREHLRTHLCIQADGLVVFGNVDTGSECVAFE